MAERTPGLDHRRHRDGPEPDAIARRPGRARPGRRARTPPRVVPLRPARRRAPSPGASCAASRPARTPRPRRRRSGTSAGPEVSAGNGSVMYCAPLGLAYANRPERLLELAPALSALTHVDGRCRTAVTAVTLGVAALVRGEPAHDAARSALAAVADLEGGEELEFLVEAVGGSRAIDGPDQGFCLFTAGAAFQALVRPGDVETELRRVVSLGGDTDTNAAVAGALLGARDGVAGPAARLARTPPRRRRDPHRGRGARPARRGELTPRIRLGRSSAHPRECSRGRGRCARSGGSSRRCSPTSWARPPSPNVSDPRTRS